MSFYIAIDNPKGNKPASLPHENLLSCVFQGCKKVCLVTAFTEAVNEIASPVSSRSAREYLGVAVTLAGEEGSILLPFMADEFQDLVVDAQRTGKIADFTSNNWSALVDDLVAIRKRIIPTSSQCP